jgi:hypothetical protein
MAETATPCGEGHVDAVGFDETEPEWDGGNPRRVGPRGRSALPVHVRSSGLSDVRIRVQ